MTAEGAVAITIAMARLLFFPLLLTALAGCTSLESNARNEFARENSCPKDRVIVSHAPPRPAPPEVAADPGRLAVWNDNEAKRSRIYYVASGCGRESRYLCEHRSVESDALPNCLLQP